MAKKKKTSKRKPASSKKTSKKRAGPAKVQRVSRNSAAKKLAGNSNSVRSGRSVDSLLKRFAKERAQQESRLDSLRTKKAECEERTRKMQEQIAKLTSEVREVESCVAQLDEQRDHEVKELLVTLGIQLHETDTANTNSNRQPHQLRLKQTQVSSKAPSSGRHEMGAP